MSEGNDKAKCVHCGSPRGLHHLKTAQCCMGIDWSNLTFKARSSVPERALYKLIVAVDFDGTCVTHEYPKVGRFIGAEQVLARLVRSGAKLILWTMRSGEPLKDAVEWFSKRQIPLFGINSNPEQSTWTESPKAYAHLYIDDAALGVPLCEGLNGERPYVDWEKVEQLIFGN